jgi:hypothetical protein
MSPNAHEPSRKVDKVEIEDGGRLVVSNASEVGKPPGQIPDKWYVLAYPSPIGAEAGHPSDTADEAERAARVGTVGRQARESVARCVAAMVRYHDDGRSWASHERMVAEVQAVAGFVEELGLTRGAVVAGIFGPVEAELVGRFGPEPGARLVGECVYAFESLKSVAPYRP